MALARDRIPAESFVDPRGASRMLEDPRQRMRREYERRRSAAQNATEAKNRSIARVYDLVRANLPALEPGEMLSEADLVRSTSSSRNAVRGALQLLTQDGFLTRKTKTGTRTGNLVQVPFAFLVPDEEKPALGMSGVTRTRVVPAPPFVQEMFDLPAGAAVARIRGFLYFHGERVGVNSGYVPLSGDEAARADELTVNEAGIIDFLERSLGVALGGSHARVGALGCDEETAELLGVAVGAPMLWLEQVFVDVTGRKRGLLHVRYRGDAVEFSGDMRRFSSPSPAH